MYDDEMYAIEEVPMTRQERVLAVAAAVEIKDEDISDVEDE